MATTVTRKTYQQRNALAQRTARVLLAIPPITTLTYKPFLAALEASTMGALGTSKDGFDATLAPLVAALPLHDAQLTPMDAAIKAASFTPGAIVKAMYSPIGTQIATLTKTGDALLKTFTGDVGNQTTTNPPAGGGGGSGSSGGGSGGTGGGGGYTDVNPGGGGGQGSAPGGGVDYPRFHAYADRIKFTPPTRAALAKGRTTA